MNWISVKDRLPEGFELPVLTIDDNGCIEILYYEKNGYMDHKICWEFENGNCKDNVTYWCHLDEIPKPDK